MMAEYKALPGITDADFGIPSEPNNTCSRCGGFAGFEQSPEGSNCTQCGDWVCDECVSWKDSDDPGFVCKLCSGGH